jgi:hypothetical protein
MGRYYYGDIEGKFVFAIQSSWDADNFGVKGIYEKEEYEYSSDDDNDASSCETSYETYYIHYRFEKSDLDYVILQIGEITKQLEQLCSPEVYKQIADYKKEHPNEYSYEYIINILRNNNIDVDRFVEIEARLELGIQIKECIEETGRCHFKAEP